MRKLFSMIVGVLATAMALQANAGGLKLGQPDYGGTGCPAGTASATLSPDESAISILFDNYVTEAGSAAGRRVDRKSCNISVPVAVPQGYSVAVFQVDYRGFTLVPVGGRAQFDAEYFWAGSVGPKIRRVFTGPVNDNYTLGDSLMAQTMVWTPCGASVNLRINSSMMAMSNSSGQQTMATVDSADISSGLVYHIQWRQCR